MDSVKSTGRNAGVANQSTNLFIAEIGSNSANSKLSDHCGCLERSGLGTASAIYFEYIRYLCWVEVAGSLLQDISGIYPYTKNPFHWDFLESKLKSITNHQALTDMVESPQKDTASAQFWVFRFTLYILYIHSKLDFYKHHRLPRNPGHLWQRHHVPERDSAPTARKRSLWDGASGTSENVSPNPGA